MQRKFQKSRILRLLYTYGEIERISAVAKSAAYAQTFDKQRANKYFTKPWSEGNQLVSINLWQYLKVWFEIWLDLQMTVIVQY